MIHDYSFLFKYLKFSFWIPLIVETKIVGLAWTDKGSSPTIYNLFSQFLFDSHCVILKQYHCNNFLKGYIWVCQQINENQTTSFTHRKGNYLYFHGSLNGNWKNDQITFRLKAIRARSTKWRQNRLASFYAETVGQFDIFA